MLLIVIFEHTLKYRLTLSIKQSLDLHDKVNSPIDLHHLEKALS